MTQCITTRFVGLDVHKDSIVIAVAERGPGCCPGGRYGAFRMESLEESARQAWARVRGSLLLRGGADRIRLGKDTSRRGMGLRCHRALFDSQEAAVSESRLIVATRSSWPRTIAAASWSPCSFPMRTTRSDPRPGAGTGRCQEDRAGGAQPIEQVPAPQWKALPRQHDLE